MKIYHEEKHSVYCGYEYKILFMREGYRCGCVKVPNTHPYAHSSKRWWIETIHCHNGITFFSMFPNNRISDNEVWLGFDCIHWYDKQDIETFNIYFPGEYLTKLPREGTIKTLQFCEEECKNIIDQLIQLEEKENNNER